MSSATLPTDHLFVDRWSPPVSYDLSIAEDRKEFESLRGTEGVRIYDRLDLIASDLSKIASPGDDRITADTRLKLQGEIMEAGDQYGMWFAFSWRNALVHYAPRADHRLLRTARNRELFTAEEQARLFDASIAVFGLSVGSNVLESLVRGGVGGRLLYGDPDTVSPTNMNRMSVGQLDLGTSKMDVLAKTISELDPYINQVHADGGYQKGVTDSLVADFRPDVIIDEVDDLPTKARLRLLARELGVTVLMATDLGHKVILDVERYDQPGQRLFNGRLDPALVTRMSEDRLTDKEKKECVVKLVGLRHASPRMIRSFTRLGETLPGIPQLGSTARMAGSIATIAVQDLILDRKVAAGRHVISPRRAAGLGRETGIRESTTIYRDFLQKVRKQKS